HDDVVEPAGEIEKAVLVEVTAVGSREPPALELRFAAQILARHLLAADPDLARFTGRHRLALRIADLQFEGRDRPADRLQPAPDPRVGGRHGLTMVVRTEYRRGGAGLGEPVGVDEIDV